jgi:hypothetical protein
MKNTWIPFIKFAMPLLVLLTVLTGCTALESEFYPGEQVTDISQFLAEESVWTTGDGGAFYIRPAGTNTFQLTGLEWNKKAGSYEIEKIELILSKLDDQLFISCKEDNDDHYVIVRLVLPETSDGLPETAILLNIDEEKIIQDAEAGLVKFKAKKSKGKPSYETTLTGTKEEQDEYFKNNPNSLYDLNGAVVLKRVSVKRDN